MQPAGKQSKKSVLIASEKKDYGNRPPYGRIWTIFFFYTVIVAVFIQLVALRYGVPENWEVVQGLLLPDSKTFHMQARDMAERIKAEGWSMWQLRPDGQLPVGTAALVYTFCGSQPWILIPLNALLHATSGLLILLSLQFLLLNWRYALLCSLPFLLFPTPITWYAQIHKDGWAIAGMAMILYGTLSLIAGGSRADKPYLSWWAYPLMIVGIFFVYLARPYLMPIYQAILAVVLLLYLIVSFHRFGRKNSFGRFAVAFGGIGGAILLMSLLESGWIAKIYPEAIAPAAHNPKSDNLIIADDPAIKNIGVVQESSPEVQYIFTQKKVAAKPEPEKFEWHNASWLPNWLNHKLRQLSKTRNRWIILGSDAASSIDQEILFASPKDMINYLPRAAQVAFLSPFPSFWLGKGSLPANTLMRRVAAFEMAFVYLALIGIVLALFYWWKRLELWCILVFCCLPMLVYAMAVINIGTLYRMRYGFLTTLVALGCSGTLKFLGDHGMLYAKKKTGQSRKTRVTDPTILFAINSLGLGGAEKQMALLIKHLDRLNFSCHLFALEPIGPLKDSLRTAHLQVHSGGYSSEKSWTIKIFLLIRGQLRLQRLIRHIRPHIVHAYLPLTNFMASFAGRILNVPMIITSKRALGTHQERNWGWRIFDIACFRFSHLVTVNSQAVAEDTIRRDRGNAAKIRLIYNGLSLEECTTAITNKREIREALHLDTIHKIVITVANLISYKGHSELLKAAAMVIKQFSNSIFLLVGEDRGIQKDLEQQAQELGIGSSIIFLGQRKDILDLMAASDISVLASHEEGFSNVVLESMAAGLPLVATRVGGNPEAIIDGETGWLVPPKKPKELASKILDLLNDPEKAKKWGQAGRHRVKQNFSHEKMVAEFVKLYCETELMIEQKLA